MVYKVSLVKCSTYKEESLSVAINGAINYLGGIVRFVRPEERIFLKVNLLNASPPEKAVTTHPNFLKVVAEEVIKAGGVPVVGDSPGGRNTLQSLQKILQVTKIGKVCQELQIPFVLLDEELKLVEAKKSAKYRFLKLGKKALECDGIISLPKLKTHGFMKLTCAVKNLFGLVPGRQKAEFHLRVSEKMDFAHLLLDIYKVAEPRLNLVDAVVSMEGNGPSAGEPRFLGYIIAGKNGLAVDWVASQICGFNPLEIYTNLAARNEGLISEDEIEILGASLEEAIVPDFKHPPLDLFNKVPYFLRHRIRKHTTPFPYLGFKEKCTKCGVCERNCPVEAILLSPFPAFDYDNAFRCYCCHELCTENAIDLKVPFLSRIFSS